MADLEAARQEALIGPLRNIYGVSDKVLTMALYSLLIGACKHRTVWFETGRVMVAVDTLVHNFLHRTGILEPAAFPIGMAWPPMLQVAVPRLYAQVKTALQGVQRIQARQQPCSQRLTDAGVPKVIIETEIFSANGDQDSYFLEVICPSNTPV